MTVDLDDAVRASLADIVAAAPRPGEEPTRIVTVDSGAPARRPFLAVAASLIMLVAIGALVFVSTRGPSSSQSAATATGFASTTIDPFAGLDLLENDVPADLVLQFTASLGDFGRLWVYESESTGQIYFVRRGASSGDGFGQLDRSTYESGQSWSLEGQPGTTFLWGLAPPSLHLSVAFGTTVVSADENGLWYTAAPDDLPAFTITTPTNTINVDLVTSSESAQTTVATTSG
jgi:hypothetical protein